MPHLIQTSRRSRRGCGGPGAAPQPDLVERLVAHRSGVCLRDLYRPKRSSCRVNLARQTAMYLERVALGLGFSEIARRFMRHPSTAIYACRRIEDKRDDPVFDRWIEAIEDRLARRTGGPAR